MESLSDAELIAASLDDPDRFSVIYRRHRDDLFRFVARRVGSDRAADLTADVFLLAFQHRGRFDTARSTCRPWLFGIAVNVVGDELRKYQRRARLFPHASSVIRPEDPFAQVDDRIRAEALSEAMERALESLGKWERELFLLYVFGELTYPEIAETVGIPVGTVRSRVSRIRAKLRRQVPEVDQAFGDKGEGPR